MRATARQLADISARQLADILDTTHSVVLPARGPVKLSSLV